MKKLLKLSLLMGMLFAGTQLFAQQANPFITKTAPPIPVLISSEGQVHVSVIDGKVDGQPAFSLVFENTGTTAVTFSWSLLSPDGKIVGETRTTSLAAHAKIDYTNGKNLPAPVVFVIRDNEKYTDYKVEIKY